MDRGWKVHIGQERAREDNANYEQKKKNSFPHAATLIKSHGTPESKRKSFSNADASNIWNILAWFPWKKNLFQNAFSFPPLSLRLCLPSCLHACLSVCLCFCLSVCLSLHPTSLKVSHSAPFPSLCGSFLWNNLPLAVRSLKSFSCFKRKFHAHFDAVT